MTELQKKLLELLKWFDEFCKKNNLRYFLVGGTMLGATRHQGFIPWDDDIDVGMPRADYERMAKILSLNPDKNYILETPYTPAKDFYYPYSKIYDTSTTLIENTKYKIRRGIYIDVFPLDGIGNTPEVAAKNYKKIKKQYQLLMTRVATVRKGRGFFKNFSVVLMRFLPKCFFDEKKLLKKLDETCSQISFDDSKYVANLVGNWWDKEIMPKNVFGTPKSIVFENLNLFGVEFPDEYLTHLYGNWKKLPPVEKQISHHDFIYINLNEPYID